MTVIEVAKELRLKVRTVRRWIAMGWLDAEKKSDNQWYINLTEEDRKRADEHRKFAPRAERGSSVGMLAGRG